MKYRHHFRIQAPLAGVAAFHSQASSMAAITPPPILVRMQRTAAILAEGDEMEFTLWLGPLPVYWHARIENTSPTGFTDRQLRGPFAKWIHRHSFVAINECTTQVVDDITIQLRLHLLWGPVGLAMFLGLPVLFAYRGWKTKRLLQ